MAIARQRGIDVVLNNESKRETPALVFFGDKQQFHGTAIAATSMMNPKNTISQIKQLIGRPFSEPKLQQDLKSLLCSVTEGPDGFPLIHARYLGGNKIVHPNSGYGNGFFEYEDDSREEFECSGCRLMHWDAYLFHRFLKKSCYGRIYYSWIASVMVDA